jgi:hypothetical protein
MIRFLLAVLCNMVLSTSSSGIDHSNKYEVYQHSNNYSRPVTAVDEKGDHYIYGMSGIHGGYIIKFDNNAEVVREGQKWFEYHSNADIKQFKGKYSQYFLCVSSKENNEHDKIIFTDTRIISYDKGPVTLSYKVALTPLKSGEMLVNWVQKGSNKNDIVVSYQYFDE